MIFNLESLEYVLENSLCLLKVLKKLTAETQRDILSAELADLKTHQNNLSAEVNETQNHRNKFSNKLDAAKTPRNKFSR